MASVTTPVTAGSAGAVTPTPAGIVPPTRSAGAAATT